MFVSHQAIIADVMIPVEVCPEAKKRVGMASRAVLSGTANGCFRVMVDRIACLKEVVPGDKLCESNKGVE
jgi:hypothetical protein